MVFDKVDLFIRNYKELMVFQNIWTYLSYIFIKYIYNIIVLYTGIYINMHITYNRYMQYYILFI